MQTTVYFPLCAWSGTFICRTFRNFYNIWKVAYKNVSITFWFGFRIRVVITRPEAASKTLIKLDSSVSGVLSSLPPILIHSREFAAELDKNICPRKYELHLGRTRGNFFAENQSVGGLVRSCNFDFKFLGNGRPSCESLHWPRFRVSVQTVHGAGGWKVNSDRAVCSWWFNIPVCCLQFETADAVGFPQCEGVVL